MSKKPDSAAFQESTSSAEFFENDLWAEKAVDGIEFLRERLIESMHTDGYWEGCLSSSALSTATAISALSLAECDADKPRILAGVAWLVKNSQPEGGWGDTTHSPSNLATTLLVLAALKLAAGAIRDVNRLPEPAFDIFGELAGESAPGESFASKLSQYFPQPAVPVRFVETVEKAVAYLQFRGIGSRDDTCKGIQLEYGKDRTFAVPILMNCALAEFVDWAEIPGLPFELALFPPCFYKSLRLHVVSYAMPALIAIGLLLDCRNPPRNPFKRLIRKSAASRVLKILRKMQPPEGGFLEAIPLTSFVAMGLVPLFGGDQPAAADCLRFLRKAQRSEGSWPIDSNLSVWLTTSAVVALGAAKQLPKIDCRRSARWIASRQYESPHPFTHAAPGGWAWTHLAGGVPDADDTSGALLALIELNAIDGDDARFADNTSKGIKWLLDLQNGDGGWPTFCRGWGKLPFDRSSPDVTAHVLRVLWRMTLVGEGKEDCLHVSNGERNRRGNAIERDRLTKQGIRIHRAIRKGMKYLAESQQADGSWIPLWFGNQAAPERTNPVVGTSLALRALEFLSPLADEVVHGIHYLLQVHNTDGGWGGAASAPSTLEETAQAVAALVPWRESPAIDKAIREGVRYLLREIENAAVQPHPIGLYFSHLWYAEKLYPPIWAIEALGRALFGGKDLDKFPKSSGNPSPCV